jgi:hypothetical protein
VAVQSTVVDQGTSANGTVMQPVSHLPSTEVLKVDGVSPSTCTHGDGVSLQAFFDASAVQVVDAQAIAPAVAAQVGWNVDGVSLQASLAASAGQVVDAQPVAQDVAAQVDVAHVDVDVPQSDAQAAVTAAEGVPTKALQLARGMISTRHLCDSQVAAQAGAQDVVAAQARAPDVAAQEDAQAAAQAAIVVDGTALPPTSDISAQTALGALAKVLHVEGVSPRASFMVVEAQALATQAVAVQSTVVDHAAAQDVAAQVDVA